MSPFWRLSARSSAKTLAGVAVATFGGVAVEDACSRALKSGEVVVVDVPWDARWTVTGMRLAVGLQRCSGCLWRCSILVGRAELS